jgi:aminopeptidase N
VELFTRLVGPFPYEKLAHLQSATRFGGMENASAIFYSDQAFARRTMSTGLIAHETAHQWFGDAVTEREWSHVWLSEGFATYFAALWTAHADGDSAFRAVMRRGADALLADTLVARRPILDTAATDLLGLLNDNNYAKGAWVLHQLHGLVGDSAFFQGIRRYFQIYRDSTALSADFARVMSEAAGTDLDWYFRQALLQPGYPVLAVRWRYQGGAVELAIRQAQEPAWGTYRLPGLEIRVDGTIHRVDVAGRETRHLIRGLRRPPRNVVVDPAGWWLLQASVSAER